MCVTSSTPRRPPLPLHDALPILVLTHELDPHAARVERVHRFRVLRAPLGDLGLVVLLPDLGVDHPAGSEEHTSELQSPCNLVCRLLLEKKKKVLDLSYSIIDPSL